MFDKKKNTLIRLQALHLSSKNIKNFECKCHCLCQADSMESIRLEMLRLNSNSDLAVIEPTDGNRGECV